MLDIGKGNINSRLTIEYRSVGALKLNPKNPREHHRTQIRKLGHCIQTFGFVAPILIDPDFNIIAGHARALAAKSIGLTEVPTCSLQHLTEAQIRAFTIADNRLSEISAWNDQLLAEELKRLSEVELAFDLEVTGFDMGEIDFRIESLTTTLA